MVDGQKALTQRPHTWAIPDLAERRKMWTAIRCELDNISRPPESAEDRAYFGDELFFLILHLFGAELSSSGLELLKTMPKVIRPDDQEHLQLQRKFDTYLWEQSRIWGWKLLMSREALDRLAHAEHHDVDMMKQFCASFVSIAKLRQHKKGGRAPVRGKDILEIEKLLLPELRTLWLRIKTEFGKQIVERTNAKLAEFIENEISQGNYHELAKELPNIIGFIENHKDSKFASRIRSRQIRPERFLHLLMEETTGYRWNHLKRLKSQ